MAYFRRLLKVASIFLLVALPVFAQTEEDEQRRRNELIEQLLDPSAAERAEAAIQLRDKLTEKELRRWLHGYKERYREDGEIRERTVPPDILRLTVALSVWPPEADKILEDLYKVEDKSYGMAIADCIYVHRKFKYIESDTEISGYIRDWWFTDWWKRIPEEYLVWPDVVEKIVQTDWIYEKWSLKEDRWDHLAVVKIMRGEDVESNPIYPWIDTFKECWKERAYKIPATFGETKYELGYFYRGMFDTIVYADVICIILQHYSWFERHKEFLETLTFTWSQKESVKVNPVTELYGLISRRKYDDAKKMLEEFALDKLSWGYYFAFRPEVIIHHPMFARFREQIWFRDWWKEWYHNIRYQEPDPTFETYPEDIDE